MGGNPSHLEVEEKVTFELNILVCGNYVEAKLINNLKDFETIKAYEGKSYIKKGVHKYISSWNYFFFSQDAEIGINTFKFIDYSITNNKKYNNIILFFSGLNEFTYKELLDFYDKEAEVYHPNFLIITKNGENFLPQNLNLKSLNPNLIKNCEIDNEVDIYIHLIEVSAYFNQLGDEIGFPKNIMDEKLLDKDNKLMTKYLFTFNILLCGKPGGGKSTLINRILGQKKAYAGKGSSTLTLKIVKYISDKYPIVIYDSPGFGNKQDIEKIQTLIKQKNESLNEEKNKIHCIFYILNAKGERTFMPEEYDFLSYLLNQGLDIYFIVTHSGTEESAKDYIGATKVNLRQNSGKDNRINDLKNNIFPVELKEDENYKKFGIKKLFTSLYDKYKKFKIEQNITPNNLSKSNLFFFGEIKTKEDLKKKLTALSERVKINFKILASTLENSPSVKGTSNLSTAVIKIISKIYNHQKTTKECLEYIQSKGYTDEYHYSDTTLRTFEKFLASIFYPNGPAAKEVESLASKLIDEYNEELNDDKKYYGILNHFNNSINEAIEYLKEVKD